MAKDNVNKSEGKMHKAIQLRTIKQYIREFTPRRILPFLCLLTLTALYNCAPSAIALDSERSNNDFSVSVDLSLNITLSSANVSLPIVPKDGGQFGRTFINVWADTNNVTGYNLTMQASGDTLTNTKQIDPAYTIDPLAQQVSCSDESDDTCTGFPVNQWGYRIGSTGAYLPASNITNIPIQLSHTHTYTTDTDPVATLYFGAKVDETKPAGIYNGVKFTFTATSNVTSASALIKPDTANGVTKITLNGEECTDDAGCLVEGLTPWESYDLVAEVAEGYTFSGWNIDGKGEVTDSTATTTQFTVGNGDATITANTNKLYMQTMTFEQCTTDGVTVWDSRSMEGPYTVKKITLNGVPTCWMMSNLKLPGGTKLTYADSNLNSEDDTYEIPADTGGSGWVNDFCEPYMATATITLNGTATTEYYYNWPTATARTNDTSNASSCSNDTDNSVGDICPKGWSLPTSTETTNSTWRSNLQSSGGLAYTGYFNSGSTKGVGSYGDWWTSTRNGNVFAYNLYYYSGTAYNNYNGRSRSKYYGYSVRCMRTS